MRIQRGKQCDWSKPFRVISSKKQFDAIEINDNQLIINTNVEENKKAPHQHQKQQIIVPKIQTVRRITTVKPFSGVPFNFIRILKALNLPKLIAYELIEVDHIFINAHQGRFKFNGKNYLTVEFLQKAFIQLELKAGKDPVIPRNKSWLVNFIERQHKQLTKLQNYEDFTQIVYNYWRNRRQEVKFPLLRPLWRSNPDEFNHLLAFKIREKEKRNLRRTNRVADDDISIQLADEFENMLKLCQRIKMRQQLKLKAIKLQFLGFHNDCHNLTSQMNNYVGQVKKQMTKQDNMAKDKQKIRNFQVELENFKKKRQSYQEEQEEEPEVTNFAFDQKLTTVNFISTVCSFAEQFGISYDTFYPNYSNTYQEKQQKIPSQLSRIPSSLTNAPISEQPIVDKSQILNLEVSVTDNLLIRKFQHQDQSFSFSTRNSSENFLQFRKKDVCSYYFGEDDEGDYKDLRKTISTSFKKFVQFNRQPQ